MSKKLAVLLFFGLSLQLPIAPVHADGVDTPTVSPDSNEQKNASTFAASAQPKPDRAAWDAWQKALSEELYAKVQHMLKEVGPPENERDFFCKVRWRIYQHGRVIPMNIDGTDSELFRGIVRKALDSMQSGALIKFPQGYSKEYVEKKSTLQFWWRYPRPGEGIIDLDPTTYTPALKEKSEMQSWMSNPLPKTQHQTNPKKFIDGRSKRLDGYDAF